VYIDIATPTQLTINPAIPSQIITSALFVVRYVFTQAAIHVAAPHVLAAAANWSLVINLTTST
jgi:hypothetical protein